VKCFALDLGKDPILKERLLGLTNAKGNYGEDVKEYHRTDQHGAHELNGANQ